MLAIHLCWVLLLGPIRILVAILQKTLEVVTGGVLPVEEDHLVVATDGVLLVEEDLLGVAAVEALFCAWKIQ